MLESKIERKGIEPEVFGLWIAIGSIVMMFAAFTSAYIVRQAQGNWLEFRLPDWFFWSTLIIIASSFTIHFAYKNFLARNIKTYKKLYLITFILGFLFVITQYLGWIAMHETGVELTGNPSGSFVYVISGVHALHVLGGLAALAVGVLKMFILPNGFSQKRKTRFKMMVHYWHFVDILWIYLLLFFILQ